MDSRWLKLQFDCNPNKTKAALARALGLEAPAISKILAGTRQIKAQEYVTMRKFFGLADESNKAAKPTPNSYIIEPLQNLSENQKQSGQWSIPAGILGQKTAAAPEQIKIFLIEENAMEPDLKKGEHVIVDMSDRTPSPPGTFVISDGFGYLARSCAYVAQSSPPEITISANQNNFEPQRLKSSEIHIIGRIIGKMQWL